MEVFPTAAAIRAGHRLRISIPPYDVPHLLPPAPDAPTTLVPLTLHTSRATPSFVTLPTR